MLTLVFCLLVTALGYTQGVKRGMDTSMTPGSEHYALSIAISDRVYGLNQGYVFHGNVFKAMWDVYVGTGQPWDFARFRDPKILNDAIRAAASLGSLPPGTVDNKILLSMEYVDFGYVDYAKLAFAVFGLDYRSLYKLHFLLLTLSLLAFVLTFRSNPLACVAIAAFAFAFTAEIYSTLWNIHTPTVFGVRHGSVLAIPPALHLGLLLMWKVRATWQNALLALVQIAILVLAVATRGVAQWAVLLLIAIAALRFVIMLWPLWRSRVEWRMTVYKAVTESVRWPLVLTLVALVAHGAYVRSVMHPVYDSDDVLPHHVFWHTIFMNYAPFDDDLMKYVDKGSSGDEVAFIASYNYGVERRLFSRPASYASPLVATRMRMGLHEKLLRRMLIEHWKAYPSRPLTLYLIKKPYYLITSYAKIVWATYSVTMLLLNALVLLGSATVLSAYSWSRSEGISLVGLMALMLPLSGLSLVLTSPEKPYMGDIYITWPALISIALALAIAWRRRLP